MTNPIPNSPKFARLNDCQKLRLLAERWAKNYGPRTIPTLAELRKADAEAEAPQPWYYQPDSKKALRQWQDNTHLARCSAHPNTITYKELYR